MRPVHPASRRLVLSALLIAAFLAASGAAAREIPTQTPFTPESFARSQREGKPILVYISASWCPTCAIQQPILDQLIEAPEFHDLLVYRIDFDTQKDFVRAMGAQIQSTLIVFHGFTEKGRLIGDTDRDAIKALLDKAYQ